MNTQRGGPPETLGAVLSRYPTTTPIQSPSELNSNPLNSQKPTYFPNPECPECSGRGYLRYEVSREDKDFGKLLPCDAPGCLEESFQVYRHGSTFLKHKGVSRPHLTFESFQLLEGTEEAFESMRALAYGTAPFIFLALTGGSGNGKTHLANAFVRVVNFRGLDCRLYTIADLLSHLNEGINDEAYGYEARVAEVKNFSLLVLDDFKPEYASRRGADRIEEIIDYRYRNLLPTVLISNRDIGELPERIVSRFSDSEIGRIVANRGADYRMRKAI